MVEGGAVIGSTAAADRQFVDQAGLLRADGAAAVRLDCDVREHLAASLRRALRACVGHLQWDEQRAEGLLRRILVEPQRPAVIAIYADLVEALFRDDMPAAQILLDELLALPPPNPGWLRTLDDWSLGAGQAARYTRIAFDEPGDEPDYAPFKPADLTALEPRVAAAMALLDDGAPELAAELRALFREVVLVDESGWRPGAQGIAGSSSFYLWGAPFINIAAPPDRLALAEAMVHEAGHHWLFGLTMGGRAVLNDRETRYPSPLRQDARPMEGLVHAAYVIARMSLCMAQLLTSDALAAAERADAQLRQRRNASFFAAAEATISAHAEFSVAGWAAFQPAAAYMRQLSV